MRDLTGTAANNAARRRTQADATAASDPSGRTAQFRGTIGRAKFSTNIDFSKVLVFDAVGGVVDARRVYEHYAGSRRRGLADFGAAQGAFLARRVAFEGIWRDGSRLVYGAVNAGGLGTEGAFGPVCLVLNDADDPPADSLAVFPGNSVLLYTTRDGVLDEGAAVADATPWTHRGDLAAVKHGGALAADPATWPSLVCNPDAFLEVPRGGTLPIASLSEVRLRRRVVRELDVLRARAVRHDVLSADEANMAAAYDRLHRWRRSYGVTITELA